MKRDLVIKQRGEAWRGFNLALGSPKSSTATLFSKKGGLTSRLSTQASEKKPKNSQRFPAEFEASAGPAAPQPERPEPGPPGSVRAAGEKKPEIEEQISRLKKENSALAEKEKKVLALIELLKNELEEMKKQGSNAN